MPSQWTISLGASTEKLAGIHHIDRDAQDAFALRSHQLTAKAYDDGFYAPWVIPVPGTNLDHDENLRRETTLEQLAKLKPAFVKDGSGTVTAGNASSLNDGAAAVLIADETFPAEPIARVAGRGTHAVDPDIFGIAPVEAANHALAKAGIGWDQVKVVELNEAFAAQSVACVNAWLSLTPSGSTSTAARSRSAIRSVHPARASSVVSRTSSSVAAADTASLRSASGLGRDWPSSSRHDMHPTDARATALHYETSGPSDAPALILSGSLGADLSMWEPQLPLADRFRVIRVDTRGHGRSPAPPGPYRVADLGRDVMEPMDTLALKRVGFAGVSLGAMIGLWIASIAPQRLTGLVSICSAAHVPNGDAFRDRAAAVRAAGGTSEIADAVVDRWLTAEFAAARPDARQRLRAMILAADPEGYASCADAVAAFDLRPQLSSIVTPTLVISGAQDQALPVALQEELAAGIPGARHVILDPGAHIASVERASDINELIERHLE